MITYPSSPCDCNLCASRPGGPIVAVEDHAFALQTADDPDGDTRWRWLCTCPSAQLRPGRWQWQSPAAAYHSWRRHVGLAYGGRPWADRAPDVRCRRVVPGVHDQRTWALRGSAHGSSKLDEGAVRVIRAAPATGPRRVSHTELGRRFGVDADTVASVRSGRTWSHVR